MYCIIIDICGYPHNNGLAGYYMYISRILQNRILSLTSRSHVEHPGWKGAREYAQFRGISAVLRVNLASFSRAFSPFLARIPSERV